MKLKQDVQHRPGVLTFINTSGTNLTRLAVGANGKANDLSCISYIEKILVIRGEHPDFRDSFIDSLPDVDELFEESERDLTRRHRDNPSKRDRKTVLKTRYALSIENDYVEHLIECATKAGYTPEDEPNMAKILQEDNNIEILKGIVRGMFGKRNATDHKNLKRLSIEVATGEAIDVIMLNLQTKTNKQLKNCGKAFRSVLGKNYKVYVISGEFTSNRKAEKHVRMLIRKAKKTNKKVVLLSSRMAFRSFSISEIRHFVHMRDSGDINNIDQAGSRPLTPGKDYNNIDKMIAHELFYSFDTGRHDTVFHQLVYSELVALEKKLCAEHDNLTTEEVRRMYWDCIPMKRINKNGKWDIIPEDELIKELKSTDNLIQLGAVNLTLNLGDLNDNVKDILSRIIGALAENSKETPEEKKDREKAQKLFKKAKTQKTLKDGESTSDKDESNEDAKKAANAMDVVRKMLVRLMSGTIDIANHVEEITDKQPDDYCLALNVILDVIEGAEWIEEYGVDLAELVYFINELDMNEIFSSVMCTKIENEEKWT